jgi:hypothetical protein
MIGESKKRTRAPHPAVTGTKRAPLYEYRIY